MSHRYGVLQAHAEGSRLIGISQRLQEAVEIASENSSYEVYDYERHEFIALPLASPRTQETPEESR